MRNRSRPPKAVRAAKGGGKDRARSQPASQAEAPPGVRPPPPKPERSEQPPAAAAPADESSSSSRTASSDSDSDTGQGPTPPVIAPDQDMSACSEEPEGEANFPFLGRQRRSLSLVPLLGP